MVPESSDQAEATVLQRARSAALLAAMVVVLGALAAGILAALAVATTSLIDHALG